MRLKLVKFHVLHLMERGPSPGGRHYWKFSNNSYTGDFISLNKGVKKVPQTVEPVIGDAVEVLKRTF